MHRTIITVIAVAEFKQACTDSYSHLRLALRKKGKPTGEMDLLITSVAVAHQAFLVTHNTKHFIEIEGLDLEDWLI